MPKVTIWIKEQDYDKWLAIEDRPEWLHDKLNTPEAPTPQPTSKQDDDLQFGMEL